MRLAFKNLTVHNLRMKSSELGSNRNTSANDVMKFQKEALEELALANTLTITTKSPFFIASKIFNIANARDLSAETRGIVSGYLQNNVSRPHHRIPLGWIKDFEIELKFVSREWKGEEIPNAGKDFYIALSPYHGRNYIAILVKENKHVVLLGRDQEKLTGTLSMYGDKSPTYAFPDLEYTPGALNALLGVPMICPYIPSRHNYREI
jgi:hypothetical protein